jgi:uncharacterized protein YbjT (DUF2867 family)
MSIRKEKILVTGTTGYIGGRLVPDLVEANYQVRILTREPARLVGRKWQDQVEVIKGDILNPETCFPALADIDIVYYMISQKKSADKNIQQAIEAARVFSNVAKEAGVRRIIYLGGIETENDKRETHQQSRMLLGDALRESGISVIELRASIIIGSGSLFFEMIRHLVEKLPVMFPPKSFSVTLHPIAVHDVLEYLVKSIDIDEPSCLTIDIGASNTRNLCEMLSSYASIRNMKRWIALAPVIPDWVAAFWINFVTPVPMTVARPLIKEMREEKIRTDQCARTHFPDIAPLNFEESVKRSLAFMEEGAVETRWTDSFPSNQSDESLADVLDVGGVVYERRENIASAPASAVFSVIQSLGGSEGWLFIDWAWRMRGFLDRMSGGVGLQRGRRIPTELRVGDALDFWRVEAIIPDRLLRLRAEMKVPGQAWLEFEIEPVDEYSTSITQIAFFAPKGLVGFAYWYLLYPIHQILFTGMIQKISEKSISLALRNYQLSSQQ